MGTPDFAVPTLAELIGQGHDIACVYSQPPRPKGRGYETEPSPVHMLALTHKLPVRTPVSLKDPAQQELFAALSLDATIVVAYGLLLPKPILDAPKLGCFNLHGSLLPRWRGAAPIQRAIEAGDAVTGATIMRIDEELDHGPMLAIATTEIGADERTPALARRLSTIGAEALARVLRDLEHAVETPQDHARATLAPKIEKSEGEIRFDEGAQAIYNRFRAFDPWPGIFVVSNGEPIKLTELTAVQASAAPRTILAIDDGVTIACGDGALRIVEMQRPGKPRTPAAAVARGLGWRIGERVP
ncbi:MAG: methionyl-tRNA formyltransferase [Acidobacteria bacterium]|nr:methionyl-tRNA formyltransferase [Acidobacteriota bacterium]